MSHDLSSDAVAAIVSGGVDLHGRSSAAAGQVGDLLDVARDAAAAGLEAIVFMDRHFPPTPLVQTLRNHEFAQSRTTLLSGIELNSAVGGLNVYAVEHELMLGGRVVSMPTISAANHIRQFGRDGGATRDARRRHPAIEVLDPWGEPLDAVKNILDVIAAHDAVLATGHLHVSEIGPLLAHASRRGVNRFLVTHSTFETGMSMADMRDFAAMGAFVEQCVDGGTDCLGGHIPSEHARAFIAAASVSQTILVPRNSRTGHRGIGQRLGATVRCGVDLGYREGEVRQMISTNAMRLLGLPGKDRG